MSDSLLDTDLSDLLRTGYAELEQLLETQAAVNRQQFVLDRQIAKLTEKIIKLSIASDDETLVDAVRETGLSDAVRTVLKAADSKLPATEIRKRLEEIGFDTSAYQNFLATLYLTLDRLRKQNEVTEEIFLGTKVYNWQPTKPESRLSAALRRRPLPNEGITVTEPIMPPPPKRGWVRPPPTREEVAKRKRNIGDVVMEIGAKALDESRHPKKK